VRNSQESILENMPFETNAGMNARHGTGLNEVAFDHQVAIFCRDHSGSFLIPGVEASEFFVQVLVERG
jgi:hypothetical protein